MIHFIKKGILIYLIIIGIGVVLYSCKKELVSEPLVANFDTAGMLINLSDNYILPAYKEYALQTNELNLKALKFTNTPDSLNLLVFRTQWENTLLTWQDVGFLNLGPALNLNLILQTNTYPTDTAIIKSNISMGSYNLELQSNYSAKGFQAIDYLINGTGNADQAIINYFAGNNNAKKYLLDIVKELNDNALSVSLQWENSYAAEFKSKYTSNTQGSSVSNLLNGMIQHYEIYVRKGKIGLPVGVFNTFSGKELPNRVESFYYKKSLPFATRAIESVEKFFNGISYTNNANNLGFDDYLVAVKAEYAGNSLNELIKNQINSIKTSISGLNDPLSLEVVNRKTEVTETYSKMQQLLPYLKIETPKALGVLITYSDTDGD